MQFGAVDDVFRWGIEQGVFPGAVVLLGSEGRVRFHRAYGFKSLLPAESSMTRTTVFDLSSLTKPIATVTAVMQLVRDRKVDLDHAVCSVIPGFKDSPKDAITCRQLLNHSSGLPAWKAFYQDLEQTTAGASGTKDQARRYVWRRIDLEPLVGEPGKSMLYSDLGFIVLGEIIERASGLRLDEFCRSSVFAPMGLESTFFVDLLGRSRLGAQRFAEYAATEFCGRRQKVLRGEVHDDNAYAMGGVAGHAGLFSTALDIHRLVNFLSECYHGRNPTCMPGSIVREFLEHKTDIEGSTFALGWDTPTVGGSSSGQWFSRKTVGHLGFTGTSLWWDLERDIHVVLLTNRVHPSRHNDRIREFRPLAHDVIMEAVLK
jgi:CubicO group peptidase (beta-lactamase class C family)